MQIELLNTDSLQWLDSIGTVVKNQPATFTYFDDIRNKFKQKLIDGEKIIFKYMPIVRYNNIKHAILITDNASIFEYMCYFDKRLGQASLQITREHVQLNEYNHELPNDLHLYLPSYIDNVYLNKFIEAILICKEEQTKIPVYALKRL